METPTFIFAEVSPYFNKKLEAEGWTNLVQITFYCSKAFDEEGYHPMAELLHTITNWKIGSDILNQKIVALYDVERKELCKLAERLERACICEGAFPIKVYGVAGLQSMFS